MIKHFESMCFRLENFNTRNMLASVIMFTDLNQPFVDTVHLGQGQLSPEGGTREQSSQLGLCRGVSLPGGLVLHGVPSEKSMTNVLGWFSASFCT